MPHAGNPPSADLPPWPAALAVIAHPDDESFGLGAVIDRLITAGAIVDVLCFTRGEASTLGADEADLPAVRKREITEAARELGIRDVHLLAYPDGGLDAIKPHDLADHVVSVARAAGAHGLLAFDSTGVTGHPDHVAATAAAQRAGAQLGVDVLAWTLPGAVADSLGAPFVGRPDDEIDVVLSVQRARQRRAVTCHPSQAVPGSALWQRLDLLGDREYLRWLSPID